MQVPDSVGKFLSSRGLWKALSVKETGATQSLHADVRTRDRVESGKGIANCTGVDISRERWNLLEFRFAFWKQNLPCRPDFFPMRLC